MSRPILQLAVPFSEGEASGSSRRRGAGYDPEGDRKAVAFALAGSRHHFDQLLAGYRGYAATVARSILHREEDVEDAINVAMETAAFRLAQLRGEFRPWFRAIVRRTALTAAIRNGRDASRSASIPVDLPALASAPDRLAMANQDLELVARVLESLPPNEKAAVKMVLLQGLSPAAAAEVLDVHPNTVRTHIHTARKRLRERFPERSGWPRR